MDQKTLHPVKISRKYFFDLEYLHLGKEIIVRDSNFTMSLEDSVYSPIYSVYLPIQSCIKNKFT